MQLKTYSSVNQAFYDSIPEWLVDSYRNAKNNVRIQKMISYKLKQGGGYEPKLKKFNIVFYMGKSFPKLMDYINKFNEDKSCQIELISELYRVIHLPLNYKRCVEFIYEHLVNLERVLANRKEIEDILNTTDYKKFLIAYENVNEEIKSINKKRRESKPKQKRLSDEEENNIINNRKLDVINYVGWLIGKNPLTWEEVEKARELYKLENYSYKNYEKEIKRLQKIIIELGGKY